MTIVELVLTSKTFLFINEKVTKSYKFSYWKTIVADLQYQIDNISTTNQRDNGDPEPEIGYD